MYLAPTAIFRERILMFSPTFNEVYWQQRSYLEETKSPLIICIAYNSLYIPFSMMPPKKKKGKFVN